MIENSQNAKDKKIDVCISVNERVAFFFLIVFFFSSSFRSGRAKIFLLLHE